MGLFCVEKGVQGVHLLSQRSYNTKLDKKMAFCYLSETAELYPGVQESLVGRHWSAISSANVAHCLPH